ncbi:MULTISPECIES: FeoB-associated Cys-rich membrane protein [Flavobacterium]|uniref:FeoB-associated Cys-rich membrane protein n=1 Tax=Flavobacterium ranwuense TaxID=2541725 RepID=A0ABY2DUN1_9FLAO|nr:MULTISPECIES: FeoB-associated Cys-rich membrane protein [Flavobacterium]TDE31434.1 FeoB-associated Cys-rich membrane protein [Flavobacterium ranwuense]TDE55257.1 FeoB-associated Cys-rich membrane protein [Flavobacterium sp. GT3P67]
MDIQEIIAFIALGIALAFLIKKFFFKKRKSDKNCSSGDDCGCH